MTPQSHAAFGNARRGPRHHRLLNTTRDAERAPPVPIAGDFSSSSRGLPLASPYFDVTPTEKLSIWPRKEANARPAKDEKASGAESGAPP